MNPTQIKTANEAAPDISKEHWEIGTLYTNDGNRPVMAGSGDGLNRVCMVDSTGERTRKTPYDAPDALRDARIKLIAAAPELLDICEAILRMNTFASFNPIGEKLKEIVAKAKGGV